ncbi:LOW QUALITY PROTEIN: CKLF-like MARVEL transmembrane domain-containing protein 7 [Sceloporus undulatus]|uniref:LOW QUALITY PROTEIN: CKLF-like MARVEL transmembrane domain-containing protein 7 n=1 Tax=Sceloporus undulatus TaxID=8520 RepID=UPI001C4C9AD4|nr:LOW QUALITY PROTEIN: CKLF-like MARVEL transmembrane domain-containing protein 7 [Sceloporus undulatus]
MAPGTVRTEASSGAPPGPSSSSSPPLPSSSSSGPDSGLLDRGYAGSRSALLKGGPDALSLPIDFQLLLLIGFICIRASWWTDHSTYSFFEIVSICDLVMILIFYIVYIFRIYRTLTCINWPLAEFLHYLIGTILLLIASIVAAAKSSNSAGLAAGAAFGFLASFLCILSIWLSYKVSCVTQSTDAAV